MRIFFYIIQIQKSLCTHAPRNKPHMECPLLRTKRSPVRVIRNFGVKHSYHGSKGRVQDFITLISPSDIATPFPGMIIINRVFCADQTLSLSDFPSHSPLKYALTCSSSRIMDKHFSWILHLYTLQRPR